jgi:rare lipoprotein A
MPARRCDDAPGKHGSWLLVIGYGVRMKGKHALNLAHHDEHGQLARHKAVVWWMAVGMALVLAGCASKPPARAGRAVAAAPRAEADKPVPALPQTDRDGAPALQDVPADLLTRPEPKPQVEPIRQGGPNKPYEVAGQAYAPITKDVPWSERGHASWYGTRFHGRKTASGELFNMYGFTAAHRTLPIPSYARVRHAASGKEIIVRVNDRGPFHSARVLDLSYAAALKLGIVSAGSAMVEIERLTFDDIRTGAWQRDGLGDAPLSSMPLEAVSAGLASKAQPATSLASSDALAELSPASEMAKAPAVAAPESGQDKIPLAGQARAYTQAAKGFWVQLAALGKREGVDKLQSRIASDLALLAPMLAVFKEAQLFKLQAGPYASRQEAHSAAQEIKKVLELAPLVLERR